MLDTRFLTPTRFFEVANMLSLNSKILLLLSECTLGTAVCPALSNTFSPYDEKYGKIHELTQKILFLGYIYGKFSKNFAMQNLLSITHSYFKPLKMLEESLKEFMTRSFTSDITLPTNDGFSFKGNRLTLIKSSPFFDVLLNRSFKKEKL